jgi:PPK2 family polyphosphate:nucleotide phosphotransferase
MVVLQGIDTAGKDGTIKHVFKEVGPLGVAVTAFRQPSEEELAHDFLWRVHAAAPRRGFIGIFNRSHYEDVLVGRVRKLAPATEIEARYSHINAFEKLLSENGTTILKFMLHISKKEQGERLQERLDKPKHRWKFDPADLDDRRLWNEYAAAYEIMLDRCSTTWAPWHVIPSDHKWARNAAIASIVRQTLEQMDPRYPEPAWNARDFKIV